MIGKKILVKFIYFTESLFRKNDNKCPFCGSLKFKTLYKKMRVIDINQCDECFIYWTNPIFKLWKFYDFFYEVEGLTTKKEKKMLPELFKNNFEGTDKDYRKTFDWLNKISNGKKILELGSSWGYFLYQAEKRGYEAVGVEISKTRRDFGKEQLGVKIYENMEKLVSENEKFDIIFSAHTLEHVGYQVRKILEKFRALIAKNGIIVIEVPFIDFEKKGSSVFNLLGAVHPLGFDQKFFLKNLPEMGFEIQDLLLDDNLTVIARADKS